MEEAYCSYEIAKLLKKKGFDERTLYHYTNCDVLQHNIVYNQYKNSEMLNACSAPTHQMACVWLREKGYHIYTFNLDPFWIYEIQSLTKDWTFSFGGFENHDAAIEAAIKYCLENLI
jgi:hypothetical protein